jgi:PTS system fructose-specific IIC component
MMAVDMGGPFNKASYAFSTGIMSAQIYKPIAAAMVGGMTPPLGIALATWIFKKHFSKDEQEAGKATAVLGISFITEGAIPFAAKDPFRILPATIIGSALAGSMSMIFDVELKAPHGGIFVLFIPNAVTHLGAYVGALLAGTIVTALLIGLFKKI